MSPVKKAGMLLLLLRELKNAKTNLLLFLSEDGRVTNCDFLREREREMVIYYFSKEFD